MIKTEARRTDYRFAIAHADLYVQDGTPEPYIQEAKSSGWAASRRRGDADYGYDAPEDGAEAIPAAVYLQTQWQLYAYDVKAVGVSLLSDTSNFREYPEDGKIRADVKTQEKCLALAERFWWHVQNDREPKPETWDDVTTMFPNITDTTAMVSGGEELNVLEMLKRKADLTARIKEAEEQIDDIKNAIGILIGGNAVLANAEGRVLAKAAERSRDTLAVFGAESAARKKMKKGEPLDATDLAAIRIAEEIRATPGLVTTSTWRELRF